MSNIKGKDTSPEMLVRRYIFSKGLRYRKNVTQLAGTPDIVLPKYKTVIFVHGCFWHGHANCKRASIPKSNSEFWRKKITGNINRDKYNIERLESQGWKVIEIWQCEMSKSRVDKTFIGLLNKIKSNRNTPNI